MIQAKIIELVLKAIFKSSVFKDLIKYKDEPNEADLGLIKANEKIIDLSIKLKAALDLFKDHSEAMDILQEKFMGIDKFIRKVDDNFKKIDKLTSPQTIPLKELNEIKSLKDELQGITKIINKLKKVTLLKSVFK